MAYNNSNYTSGVNVPAGAESFPSSATRDFQAGQPMSATYQAPASNTNQSQEASSATAEDKIQREGHLPGLAKVQKDNEKDLRQPGEEDAAGNKILHKGILKKMLHWEHSGMNAD
ncbi:MAG: hypothetical protein Q9171_006657 [Xanthocarpia ochracea]